MPSHSDRLREKHPLAAPGWLAYVGSVTERTGLPDCDFPTCQPGCPDSRDNVCSRLQAIFDASTEQERDLAR